MAMTSPKEGRKGRPGVRCAIYTRKSHEEGLEQDFNSLDAQREACEAYVASQKHEGWTCLPGIYDDGGVSGATLERPALKRLLEDMETGGIDAVVVYKVDRLTRTLGDFARIVEVFDRKEVSFVSITQQFNTTTSMGRLTLNMLLSFAQFEREVTSERIRDKIAASKKRGLWMGGLPPLGYDVQDRKLVVNEQEAETVRDIFRQYLETGSVSALQDRLERDGVTGKVRIDRYGRETGGKPLARGALYHLLQNRIYRGEIVHKEQSYPGEHDAIVDETLWKQVQRKLATNRTERTSGANAAEPSLLAGLVYDDTGQRMTPSHANKQGTRYRYYVSKSLVTGRRGSASRGRRVPARELEGLIEDRLRRFLASRAEIFGAVDGLGEDAGRAAEVVARANEMAGRWPSLPAPERRTILNAIVHRVELRTDTVELQLLPSALGALLEEGSALPGPEQRAKGDGPPFTFSIPARLRRTGRDIRFIVEGAENECRTVPDRSLHRLLAQAHRYRAMVMHSGDRTMRDLAAEAGVTSSYFRRILRLGFLAPQIVGCILDDRHPIGLTAKRLANEVRLPAGWDDQHSSILCERTEGRTGAPAGRPSAPG